MVAQSPDGLRQSGRSSHLRVSIHDDGTATGSSNLYLQSMQQEEPDTAALDPAKWTTTRKGFVIVAGIFIVTNSTLNSSLPSGAATYIGNSFNVTSRYQLALPVSMFLIGYIFGPSVFSPLSEAYGRRIIVTSTFMTFMIFNLGCALAPNWPLLLLFRLLVGISASAPITVISGVYADILPGPVQRGKALTLNLICTTFGPVLGPAISGFVAPVNWRWTFWISLIFAGTTLPFVLFLPETYYPVILARRAKKLRRLPGHENYFAPLELEQKNLTQFIVISLTRPLRLFAEPIICVSCMFLALEYAIYYLFFEAYPIIFQGIYGMSSGVAGLAFLPLGIGTSISGLIFIVYDRRLRLGKEQGASWALDEEYRRLPLACIGGPICVAALFWLGWTSRSDIHWTVPMLAGLLYGCGIELTFIALLNYVADAYEKWTASAMACSAMSRSLLAVLLPLATDSLYGSLGVAWASSLLGFVSLFMSFVPFIFLRYGKWLRARSRLAGIPRDILSN